jgi:hypothetical protein
MHRFVLVPLALACAAVAQETKPAGSPKLEVSVIAYGNPTCPLMSKPVKPDIFVESPKGRVWLCCKTCLARAKKDPDGAYAKAYPTVVKVNNATDPVSGKPVKPGVTVVYQGHEIGLSDEANAKQVVANGDVYVALLTKPGITDLNNEKDPVTGEAVKDNLAVIIGDSLVRLSSAESVEAVRKDPAKALETAKKSSKAPAKKAG